MSIARIDDNNLFEAGGCGCCSYDLNLENDREKIISHLKENIDLLKEACKLLEVDFNEFIK